MPKLSHRAIEYRQREFEQIVAELDLLERITVIVVGLALLMKQTMKKLPQSTRIAIYILATMSGGALILIAAQSQNFLLAFVVGALVMALIIFVARI